jgi:hypothetical protein
MINIAKVYEAVLLGKILIDATLAAAFAYCCWFEVASGVRCAVH